MNKHTALRLAAASAAAALLIACGAGTDPSASPTQTPGTPTFVTTMDSPSPAASAPAPAPSIRQAITIASGTWQVPEEVKPGTYKTRVPADSWNCYWERLRNFDSNLDSIIANGNAKPDTNAIVTIGKADKGFHSDGCGTWTKIK